MRTLFLLALVGGAFCISAFAQRTNVTGIDPQNPGSTREPAYEVVERSANERVWRKVTWEYDSRGQAIGRTNSYTELATGLHYFENGQWKESREEIEILQRDAGAVARKGPHKVIFPTDIGEGRIEMQLPSGDWLRSRVLGLSYYDTASGRSVLIAEGTNSVGVLHGSNVVIYPDAFTDFEADIRYTYTREGFEQDVILRSRPPLPEEFHLDSRTTRLQILTEFFDPPEPGRSEQAVTADSGDSIPDETLRFGEMQLGAGRAFPQPDDTGATVPVGKQWQRLEGRMFLIEEVQMRDLFRFWDTLPRSQGAGIDTGSTTNRRVAAIKRNLPQRKQLATASNKQFRLAKDATPRKGFVLDYVALNVSTNNYTFRSDTTYHISGNVALGGTNTTFEAGTVLKYSSNVTLTVNSPVTWLGENYLPVVLTAKDDNTVGQNITGSTGTPTNYYAANALYFDASSANTNLVLQNLRVANAVRAIAINTKAGHVLKNVQLVKCGYGLALTNAEVSLRNALMDSVQTNFTGSSATGRVEHLTTDMAAYFNGNIGTNLFVTNSLLIRATNTASFTSFNNRTNSGVSGIFTNAWAGAHYLVAGSTNRNIGTTNINATLLAELKKATTYAPTIKSNVATSVATTLGPVVQRDTDVPDLGYHYDPIDYLSYSWSFNNTSLILTGGVVVAYGKSSGLVLSNSTTVNSLGSPTAVNKFIHHQTVHEQQVSIGSGSGGPPIVPSRGGGSAASGSFRFTEFRGTFGDGGNGVPFFNTYVDADYAPLTLRDCYFGRGVVQLEARDGYTFTIENNVFESRPFSACGYFYIFDYYGSYTFQLSLRNNLFKGGTVQFYSFPSGSSTFVFRDNVFDSVALSDSGHFYSDHDYTAYINTSQLYAAGAHDKVLSNFTWATGLLGKYYQQSTNFIDQGSRTASAAGLYHYTTLTNQVKEAGSTVDLGFHYVATYTNGTPVDSDGDGSPDYAEDANGNGVTDGAETSWNTSLFSKGVNLGGNAVVIDDQTWLSDSAARSAGMTVTSGITNTRAFTPSPATPDVGASDMLQGMVTRRRLPSRSEQTNAVYSTFKYERYTNNYPSGATWAYRRITLNSFPTNLDFSFLQLTNYRAWCVEHAWDDVGNASNVVFKCLMYYTYNGDLQISHTNGSTNTIYSAAQLNQVNYILNNKGTNADDTIQYAIWTVLGQDNKTNLTLYWDATNHADYVPDPSQTGRVVGVIVQPFPTNNVPMFQSCVIEAPLNTNKAVSFTINQPVANGTNSVYLWLAESEADHVRKLNIKVEGTTVITNAGDLGINQWQKLGPYTANVSDSNLTIEVSSAVQGDPVLMGFSVFTNTLASNPPPAISVQFNSPTNTQLFVYSATNIMLRATNITGSITKMLFYNGGIYIGETTNSPYQLLWTNVTAGTYSQLQAVGMNSITGISATNTISITVNAMPVITNYWPTNLYEITEPANVTLTDTAYDLDGSITNVTFYYLSNSVPQVIGVGTTNGNLYSVSTNGLAHGYYSYYAVAKDNRGAATTSPIGVFKVNPTNTPPRVWISGPTNLAAFPAGIDLTITASVATGSYPITNVEFYVNEVLIGHDSEIPYILTECCWKAGTHTLKARVSDDHGLSSLSTNIVIVVGEARPSLADGAWDSEFPGIAFGANVRYSELEATAIDESGVFYVGGYGMNPSYVGNGNYTNSAVMSYDNSLWKPIFPMDDEYGYETHVLKSYSGSLYVGGFKVGRSGETNNWGFVVKRDGTNISFLGGFLVDDSERTGIRAIDVVGSEVFVGGHFLQNDQGSNVQHIAKLAGTNWVSIGNELTLPTNGAVRAIAHVGTNLYIGGDFTAAGGNTNIKYLAKLVGNIWTNVDLGVNSTVRALAVCRDTLYVGGDFTSAGSETNVNCIAAWDGINWSSLGHGVSGNNTFCNPSWPSPSIHTISVRGTEVYVGGEFNGVYQGMTAILTPNVAKATWNEQTHEWIWAALDGGVTSFINASPNSCSDYVLASAIYQMPQTNAYVLYVSGRFDHSGSFDSLKIARWNVGGNISTNSPKVWVTSPTNFATFYETNAPITLIATAIPSGTNTIDQVYFYANNDLIAGGTPGAGNTYSTSWTPPAFGLFRIKALATDFSLQTGESPVVAILNKNSTNTLVAVADFFTIVQGGATTNLGILANDSPQGNGLRVSDAYQTQGALYAKVTVGYDGNSIAYTPSPNLFGQDVFEYAITNAQGEFATGVALVKIQARPGSIISLPVEGRRFRTNSSISLSGAAWDWDGVATNVQLLVNGSPYGSGINPGPVGTINYSAVANGGAALTTQAAPADNFSASWSTNKAGFYTFTTVTACEHGILSTSAPVTIVVTNITPSANLPLASITNLVATSNSVYSLEATNLPVIDRGLFDLKGIASDPDSGDEVAYQVLLYRPADWESASDDLAELIAFGFDPFADVTSGPKNYQGFHKGGDTNGVLCQLDLTAIPNGVYDLVLRVRGGTDEAFSIVRVQIDSQLKIGQFSFSEQDLAIPVNGIPLSVTRTYSSLNPRSGDFGSSWTYALNEMDVVIDEQRISVTALDTIFGSDENLNFSLRIGGNRDVTLTLPDGRRTTFQFRYASTTSADDAPMCADGEWVAPPGVTATLSTPNPATKHATGDDTIVALFAPLQPYWQASGPFTPLDAYDIPEFVLTTDDGTEYHITREGEAQPTYIYQDVEGWLGATFKTYYIKPNPGQPTLTKIKQRTGDYLVIGDGGVTHFNTNGVATRSVLFERDSAGRIIAIRDPNSGSNGLPVMKYVYNRDTDNLIQVQRLQDRAAGTYTVTKYHYDHPKFPHFITSIEDPRGIPLVRNLYDDLGRLIGIIDASGHTNRFEHDTANRRETQYDRSGQPTVFTYDTRGNVVGTMDALGHTNGFAYDSNGFLTNSVNALGYVTSFTNDPIGNVLSVTLPYPAGADPAAYTSAFTWDTNGNQTSVRLPTGGVISNVFDASGNLTAVKDENGNLISSTTFNALGLADTEIDKFGTNRYAFDAMGNLKWFTNSLGKLTTSSYDANGNLTSLVDASGTSTVNYDAMNRETTSDYGQGITLTNNYQTYSDWSSVDAPTIGHMERKFDDQGRLGGWVTANGATPGFAYDVNGRLEYETNSIGVVTRSVYNAVGWIVATTNLTTGAWSAYGYDAAGRKTSQTNTLGQVSWFDYWPSGSLKAMTNAVSTNYWLYSDAAGACSACGNSGSVTDALARVVESVTTAHGLPLQSIRRASPGATGANAATNSTTYLTGMTTPEQEAADYPATVTDEGGRTRQYDYTALGQLYRATDLSGATWWTNQFDLNTGALTNVVSPTGEGIAYAYDTLDNVKTIRFSDGNTMTNFFNAENRLSGVRLPSGVALTNGYDFAGRLTNRSSTIGETNTYEYNNNDAVTRFTDITGGTTNLYDAAGRLWGVDYPSGASVRYQLDLLSRIIGITNKATAGGTTYVTRYQYDAIGNITNVIDPFNGNTSLVYDGANRRSQRTLPNGVVTTWQYNWKDQVTNIVHKTSGGTVLASAYYQRAAGGEPTQITREDGSYVTLQYDPALRLTNEIYYTNSVAQTTNSYGYDAAGSRIKLVQGGLTLTNSVTAGYRITAVKDAANGNTTNSYAYDTGGRVTQIVRDGATLNLGYNSSDQVAAVTNGAAWVTHRHDANGRRTVSTNSAGTVRRLLVAPTPGTDLESPQLIANASGTVQQGYVYLGDDPILRYTTSGTASYYLEDGMGSVIGLAPASSPSTANTTRLFYDGFGNGRGTNGPNPAIPTGAGGDFRFHGAWLETDSGLYNMRAREYDTRMGRFTSRDPRNGVFQQAETLNPYVFAVNNAYVFSDASGEFSLVEISVEGVLDKTLEALKNVAVSRAKSYAKEKIVRSFSNVVQNQLTSLFPEFGAFRALFNNGVFQAGVKSEAMLAGAICQNLPKTVKDYLWLGPVVDTEGKALADGFGCTKINLVSTSGTGVAGRARPDFILSTVPPTETRRGNKALLIGDFKLSGNSLYSQYVEPGNKQTQFSAIANFTAKNTELRIALFITIARGDKKNFEQVREKMAAAGLKKGTLFFVVSAL